MKALRWVLALGAVSLLLVGCGGESSSEAGDDRPERLALFEALTVTIDGAPGPETAGLLMANQLGYFRDAGIGVSILSPLDPTRPIDYAAGESVDVAVSHEPGVLLAQEKGSPVVAVGSLVDQPTLAMIWLEKSKIGDIGDLKGKTIGIPGASFQRDFLDAVLAPAGLTLADVEVEAVGDELVPALVSGRVDAIFGGSWNVEGAALESRGLRPVVTRAADLGIPPYNELVAITNADRAAANPKLFRVFMAAVRRGTAAAKKDPAAATEAIYDAGFGAVKRGPTRAGVEATLPLLSETGGIDAGQTSDLVDWMHEEGILSRKLPASTLTGADQAGGT